MKVPSSEAQLSEILFENEDIVIVEQPKYVKREDAASRRAAIGDKVVLVCKAICRYTSSLLTYWKMMIN